MSEAAAKDARIAQALRDAGALLITAGAGMGVDSGLPDFRGDQGFWNAYPPYQRLGLRFIDLADPSWFHKDPSLAWGFYGHRLQLYRQTQPHQGYHLLRQWGERMRRGYFVFTSNVDGQFQKAGIGADQIYEVHGSLAHGQCLNDCGVGLFSIENCKVQIDETTMRAHVPLPTCPACGGLARPNVLMFGDFGWDPTRSREQEWRFKEWRRKVGDARLVIIECGAGTSVPTVRRTSEAWATAPQALLVRVNRREPDVPEGHIGVRDGALDALQRLDALLTEE